MCERVTVPLTESRCLHRRSSWEHEVLQPVNQSSAVQPSERVSGLYRVANLAADFLSRPKPVGAQKQAENGHVHPLFAICDRATLIAHGSSNLLCHGPGQLPLSRGQIDYRPPSVATSPNLDQGQEPECTHP